MIKMSGSTCKSLNFCPNWKQCTIDNLSSISEQIKEVNKLLEINSLFETSLNDIFSSKELLLYFSNSSVTEAISKINYIVKKSTIENK